MICVILILNSMILHDFRDSRLEFQDFHEFHCSCVGFYDSNNFHNYHLEFYDFHDLYDSQLKLYDFHYFNYSLMEFHAFALNIHSDCGSYFAIKELRKSCPPPRSYGYSGGYS